MRPHAAARSISDRIRASAPLIFGQLLSVDVVDRLEILAQHVEAATNGGASGVRKTQADAERVQQLEPRALLLIDR